MEIPDMEVSIVNPGDGDKKPPPKKKRAKTVADKRKRNKKGQFKKGGGRHGSKPRKRNPSGGTSRAPARRRAAPAAPRRRRRNPENGGGMAVSWKAIAPGILPAIGGRLALAYAVRNWGDTWGTGVFGAGAATSPFAGQPWTFKNYAIGLVTAYVGGKLLHKRNARWGFNFWRGGVESMAERLLWTEGIGRSSWGQANFGHHMGAQLVQAGPMGQQLVSAGPMGAQLVQAGPMGGMPHQAAPGAVWDDAQGNRRLLTPDGTWQAMLGGLMPASSLGGLQPARAVDVQGRGTGSRRMRPYLGHAITDVDDVDAVRRAARQGTGYENQYAAAYSYRG